MGYVTDYKLTVHAPKGKPINEKAIIAELKMKNTPERDAELLKKLKDNSITDRVIIQELRDTNQDAKHAIMESGLANNSCKWYDHEQDLRAFSKKHPSILFELYGEGEESGDVWKKYFLNGKMQFCKAEVTCPPFDEKKLE